MTDVPGPAPSGKKGPSNSLVIIVTAVAVLGMTQGLFFGVQRNEEILNRIRGEIPRAASETTQFWPWYRWPASVIGAFVLGILAANSKWRGASLFALARNVITVLVVLVTLLWNGTYPESSLGATILVWSHVGVSGLHLWDA